MNLNPNFWTDDIRLMQAMEIVRRTCKEHGYSVQSCTRSLIQLRYRRSRMRHEIICNPESEFPLSPIGSRNDSEHIRSLIVDALVAKGLLP